MTLAEHDKRFHKRGYRKGQSCKYREGMENGDESDLVGTGGMVSLLKDFVSGIEVEEVEPEDVPSIHHVGNGVLFQAAMAATGHLEGDDINRLAEEIESSDVVNTKANIDDLENDITQWISTRKVFDGRRLAKSIFDRIPKTELLLQIGGSSALEITPQSISEVLAHINPKGISVRSAIMQLLSARSLVGNGKLYYREPKDGREFLNFACNANDGNRETIILTSLKEVRPGIFHLHAMNEIEKANTDGTKEGSPDGEKLNYSTGVNARIMAQGVLNRQWGTPESFERRRFLRRARASSSRAAIIADHSSENSSSVAGWYDRNTGKVSLVKGRATPSTVAHEIGWHAVFHWAEKNHPELHRKLVQYAKEAPKGIEQSVKEVYGTKLTPNELLDEIGAERFTRDNVKVIDRASTEWWDKIDSGQDELRVKYVKENVPKTMSREELDEISKMEPKKAVEKLVEAMISERSLGNPKANPFAKESKANRYLRMVKDE